jgi:hypothetical protein
MKHKGNMYPIAFGVENIKGSMERSEGGCGKVCKYYNPKNGKSGCCKHYSLKFYEPTDKSITITKDEKNTKKAN